MRVQGALQRRDVLAALVIEMATQRRRVLTGRCREIREPLGQELPQHVGVTNVTQQLAEPLQLVSQRVRPDPREQGTQRPQVGPQSSGSDTSLVDTFGIVVRPHHGIVGHEPVQTVGQRGPHEVARSAATAEPIAGDHVGRVPCRLAERPYDLRPLAVGLRAGLAQPCDDLVDQLGVGIGRDLELDLVERRRSGSHSFRSDPIVVDRPDRLSVPVDDPDLLAVGRDRGDLGQGSGPGQRVDERDRLARRLGGVEEPEDDLIALQQPVLVLGQLDRPAVVRAEPQARARPGQTKVSRVVVHRLLVSSRDRVRPEALHQLVRAR